jgi:hypothetical protein
LNILKINLNVRFQRLHLKGLTLTNWWQFEFLITEKRNGLKWQITIYDAKGFKSVLIISIYRFKCGKMSLLINLVAATDSTCKVSIQLFLISRSTATT